MKYRKLELGKVASFSQGIQVGIKNQKTIHEEGCIRFLRIVDYTQNTNDIRYIKHPGEKYIVQNDDVVMVRYGAIGFVGTGLSGAIANNMFKISPNLELLDKRYLYYFLKEEKTYKKLIQKATVSTMPAINFRMVSALKISLPSLDIQNKIVEVLDKAQELIDLRKNQIELLDELIQSTFHDMFGDPVKNPKGWDKSEFGNCIDVLTDYHANGSYKILKKNVELLDSPNYALMIRTTDLENKNFDKDVKYINQHAYEFLKKTKVYGGEIIINKIGSAGRVYLMPNLNRPVSLGMNQFMIRTNKYLNNVYVYNLFNTVEGSTLIMSKVRGAVTKSITKDAIREIKIPLPPIELQNQFEKKVKKIEEQKELMSQSLVEMENNYNSIMQRAFKGELFN